ncbi:hypothetical protein J3E64_002438 [Sphingobium sp. OAS761]|uniref:hypothetical protein n=1 Tax=Sphingobium sp. OAS761 TaxID=2817901 RepID=UPI00209F258B|nr:hypothetical protein [Sphingobium sp. OAS761]MCP1470745.1 hypothetical protein [Sphingobium sp. OAS761]
MRHDIMTDERAVAPPSEPSRPVVQPMPSWRTGGLIARGGCDCWSIVTWLVCRILRSPDA